MLTADTADTQIRARKAKRRRCDCGASTGWHASWCASLPRDFDPRGDK